MMKRMALSVTMTTMAMMMAATQADAQTITFKNQYGSFTFGNNSRYQVRGGSYRRPRTTALPVSSYARDVRLRGKWTINGDDGSTTRLNFNGSNVTMLRTDEWGDTLRRDSFEWRAFTKSANSRYFTFQLAYEDGSVDTYKGQFNNNRTKALMETSDGEEMMLRRNGRRYSDF